MVKLRTIIADDEMLARKLLRASLQNCPDIELVAECKNGREAVQRSQELQPDLLFLDIHMPGMGGLDVVKELQSGVVPIVIFCSAHQRFALDVFDSYSIEYLLKPLDDTLLKRIVHRTVTRFNYQRDNDTQAHHSKTTALLAAIAKIEGLMKKLDTNTTENTATTVNESLAILGEGVLAPLDTGAKKGKFDSLD